MAKIAWYKNADIEVTPGHGLGRKMDEKNHARNMFPRLMTIGVPAVVNKRLNLPYQYVPKYDQGSEGACVGFAWSWAMSILNKRFYAARKLYLEAQFIDPWSDTPPEEGTSVVAGATILASQGHWRFARGVTFPIAAIEGIQSFRSARTVDDIRYAINSGVPVVFGIDWWSDFDSPVWGDFSKGGNRWWIGRNPLSLGNIRGGHCICCFGARDDIEAVTLVNSWGSNYPIVNVPYKTIQFLLDRGGEAIVPVDK